MCAFLGFAAPSAASLSTSCSCWPGQELKWDCLSLGYPEWFHVMSYALLLPNFSTNCSLSAKAHFKKGNGVLWKKITHPRLWCKSAQYLYE